MAADPGCWRNLERTVARFCLGAFSFWEGVDIPGDALSCVIIVKLPLCLLRTGVAARLEDLANREKDGFVCLVLPQAGNPLQQGFGDYP